MKNLKIGTRLAIGFALVIAIALAFGAFAYTRAVNGDQTADELGKVTLPSVYFSDDLKNTAQLQYNALQQYLNVSDRAELARLDNAIESLRRQNADVLAKLEALSSTDKQRTILESLKSDRAVYGTAFDAALSLSRTGIEVDKMQAVDINAQRIQPAYAKYLATLDTLVAESRVAAEDAHQNLTSSVASSSNFVLIGLACAIVFSIVISALIISSITQPLSEAVYVLDQVSKGELDFRADVGSNDELGLVLTAINRLLDNQWMANGVAEQLADGDLNANVTNLPGHAVLGRALARMRNYLQSSAEAAERLANGDFTDQARLLSETDQLGHSLTRLRAKLKTSIEAAEKIADGDLSVEINASSDKDFLAKSLLRVCDRLRSSNELTARLADGDLNIDAGVLAENDMVTRSLVRLRDAISASTHVIDRVSEGDLTVEPKPVSETDALGNALVRMVTSLREVADQLNSSAAYLSQSGKEISSTVESLSIGSREHTAAVAETASVLNGVSIGLQQNADNSQQTDKLASTAAEDGKISCEALNQTVAVMKEVSEKINAIDDIARKTDLLTLAASLEAARAGEHGLGFAVVASELRKLGERGQSAAADMVRLTSGGLKSAQAASELVAKLVPGLSRTAELVREISATSAQQSSGASQVNLSVQQLDKLILQKAAASQQMAATLEELINQANNLQGAAAFFKLKQEAPSVLTMGAGS